MKSSIYLAAAAGLFFTLPLTAGMQRPDHSKPASATRAEAAQTRQANYDPYAGYDAGSASRLYHRQHTAERGRALRVIHAEPLVVRRRRIDPVNKQVIIVDADDLQQGGYIIDRSGRQTRVESTTAQRINPDSNVRVIRGMQAYDQPIYVIPQREFEALPQSAPPRQEAVPFAPSQPQLFADAPGQDEQSSKSTTLLAQYRQDPSAVSANYPKDILQSQRPYENRYQPYRTSRHFERPYDHRRNQLYRKHHDRDDAKLRATLRLRSGYDSYRYLSRRYTTFGPVYRSTYNAYPYSYCSPYGNYLSSRFDRYHRRPFYHRPVNRSHCGYGSSIGISIHVRF